MGHQGLWETSRVALHLGLRNHCKQAIISWLTTLATRAWWCFCITVINSRTQVSGLHAVEAAGLSGSERWSETINLVCLALYRTVAEFKVNWNFKGTSTASNYGTVSNYGTASNYSTACEWVCISISISISIVPGFTTSPCLRSNSKWRLPSFVRPSSYPVLLLQCILLNTIAYTAA